MDPKKGATLQAYDSFNKLSLFIFLAAFMVVGYDAWLVSRAEQPSTHVVVSSAGFSPNSLQINAGQTVVWTNRDRAAHWIASDPYPQDNYLPSLNSSSSLKAGSSYSYTFDRSGTYAYHDNLHPYQFHGVVVVK